MPALKKRTSSVAMRQIVVTLEDGANSRLLQELIEKMNGVRATHVTSLSDDRDYLNHAEWVSQMIELSDSIDDSLLEMNDERTRYILSK